MNESGDTVSAVNLFDTDALRTVGSTSIIAEFKGYLPKVKDECLACLLEVAARGQDDLDIRHRGKRKPAEITKIYAQIGQQALLVLEQSLNMNPHSHFIVGVNPGRAEVMEIGRPEPNIVR